MILAVHILIALSSIAFATLNLLNPTSNKLKISYALIASTLISGTYMIAVTNTSLVRACGSGLAYLGAVSLLTLFAKEKLATSKIDNK